MADLDFRILTYLGAALGDPLEDETLASVQIVAGRPEVPVTEVEDRIAHTVRDYVNVPAFHLARWLLVNWWRLRWEPAPAQDRDPSPSWLESHTMAAIGGDYAWPPLTLSSDGEFVQLDLKAEGPPSIATIRYLRPHTINVPVSQFEQAVDRFVANVEARLSARLPGERELSSLREELCEERENERTADACRFQALGGFDPGDAPEEWMRATNQLVSREGNPAAEEILAAVRSHVSHVNAILSAMRASGAVVSLDWTRLDQTAGMPDELPWERGARLARAVRAKIGRDEGPLDQKVLAQLLGAKLPLTATGMPGPSPLRGGYRNGAGPDRAALLVPTAHERNQRFYLARVAAAAVVSHPDQHVLPVSNAATALQKFERSFAQELLCPWRDLDQYTDEHGTDDEAIEAAADHFAVSQLVILSALVNKGKISRSRL